MSTTPRFLASLGLLGLPLMASAQTILTSNGGTLLVNTGGVLQVNGSVSQTGAALLRTTGTAAVTGSLSGAAASSLDLSTGLLSVAGNVAHQGSTAGSTGTLRLNGSAAQTLGLSGGTVPNLTSTNASAVTLTQPLTVRQVLTLNAGSLNTNGQALLLLSDASGTALLANLGTGTVVGNLTMQRYIDPSLNPGLGYRHLAAPVQGQTVAGFGSGGTTPVVNAAYNTAANPGAVMPFPTVYYYDQSRLATSPATTLSAFDKGWTSPQTLPDAAPNAQRGFTVQLPGASTLSFSGGAEQASVTIPLSRVGGPTAADAGWNFIGNPYASPLDFSTIGAGQRANLDAAFYTYESTGAYVGQYRSYANGFGNPLIGSSQAFFVRVSQGQTAGSLTLNNANRVTDYARQAPVYRSTTDPRPHLQLTLAGAGLVDELTVYAQTGATTAQDAEFDAAKLWNPTGLNLASVAASAEALAIDGRPAFPLAQPVPLTVQAPRAGTYTLTATTVANLLAGVEATLVDLTAGTRTRLTTGTSYTLHLPAGTTTGRLQLEVGSRVTGTTPAALAAQLSLYPNPTTDDKVQLVRPATWGALQVQVLNAVGQVVHTARLSATEPFLRMGTLPAGVYSLRLITADGQRFTKRLVRQ